jgi:hypothetical protein
MDQNLQVKTTLTTIAKLKAGGIAAFIDGNMRDG